MTSSSRKWVLAVTLTLTLLIAGCIPEANRERGGGPGGDIGNWSDTMNMHGQDPGQERMYYQTPLMGQGIERDTRAEGDTPES
jgi:hypothetical protein